jgi:putative ABC transport system permease protein
MKGLLYLAWRYLAYHWFKTGILIASITLILFLPSGLRVLVKQSQQQLTARAESTPLLIGSKGSALGLVLNAVYFSSKVPEFMPYAKVSRVAKTGLAHPIPQYVWFHAQNNPIVGTNLGYFEFRNLRIQSGRQMARLGDCVAGAELAKRRGILPGHTVDRPKSLGVGSIVFSPCGNAHDKGDFLSVMRQNIDTLRSSLI